MVGDLWPLVVNSLDKLAAQVHKTNTSGRTSVVLTVTSIKFIFQAHIEGAYTRCYNDGNNIEGEHHIITQLLSLLDILF